MGFLPGWKADRYLQRGLSVLRQARRILSYLRGRRTSTTLSVCLCCLGLYAPLGRQRWVRGGRKTGSPCAANSTARSWVFWKALYSIRPCNQFSGLRLDVTGMDERQEYSIFKAIPRWRHESGPFPFPAVAFPKQDTIACQTQYHPLRHSTPKAHSSQDHVHDAWGAHADLLSPPRQAPGTISRSPITPPCPDRASGVR